VEIVEIRVRGHLDESWSGRLEGLAVEHTALGETSLSGCLPDQSALYGLIDTISGLGLQLVYLASRRTSPEEDWKYEG